MDFRRDVQSEDVNGESWLIIKEKVSFATAFEQQGYTGLKKLLNRALKKEGIRKFLPEGKRRYEFKESHGYRKFFETNAGTVMHPFNVKLLMDHELGVEASYWKPTEMQLLDDYLKAVPKLSIIKSYNDRDNNNEILQQQVAALTEKTKDTYIIKGKLAEKENEIEETKKKLAQLEKHVDDQAEQIARDLETKFMAHLRLIQEAQRWEVEKEERLKREEESSNELIKFPDIELAAKLNHENNKNKNKLIA